MRYGLAMFGLNPIFTENPEKFLQRISQMGYRYLEPCWMMMSVPGFEKHGWTEADFARYLPILEKYGVSVRSVHVFPQNLSEDLADILRVAKTYDIREIVLPCPQSANPADAAHLTQVADALKKHGIALVLHNGRDAACFSWLMAATGDNVLAQADVGWLLYNGIDPETFLWKYEKKICSIHYKDFSAEKKEVRVGKGQVDMLACFQFGRAKELIQYVDQDGAEGDFLEEMEQVADLLKSLAGARERTDSILCVLDTETGEVTDLKRYGGIIEAPNWMQQDPDVLIYNSDGRIWKHRISSGEDTLLDTGICTNCNNDHVLSFDGREIAVSHSAHSWMSQVYILPIDGGEPRLITPNAPSFLHGWSPDGKELAYCAFRDHGKGTEVDVFAISAEGGQEWQLTRNAGFNDGPEYAPNGNHIWFNSTRTGLMQCWRMDRDGGNPLQITFTDRNNWFPHVSPDGQKVLYLSYSRDGLDANEHLPNMDVQLRLMDYDGGNDRCILSFFGGQGSVNVNSWHPDSRQIAFVRYELEHR